MTALTLVVVGVLVIKACCPDRWVQRVGQWITRGEAEMTTQCGKCGKDVVIADDVHPVVKAATTLGDPLCAECTLDMLPKGEPQNPAVPVREHARYVWTKDMGEISGFGGGYEQTCRNMLVAGLEWLDAHPNAEPQFRGMKGVFGLINEENADAKALSEAIVGVDRGCTGAMHQAVVSHCLFIRKNGWDKYCAEMREGETADAK